ncbi:T9SS type A sorting domain-containing protein [Halocola ammonii]
MKTVTILSALLMVAFGKAGMAQTELPYFSGFDNDDQTNGWEEHRLGAQSDFYFWDVSSFSPFSDPNNLEHTYPVGGKELTDDWFISPGFDLPEGGTIDSLRHAFSGFGVPQAGDTIAIYALTGSQDPESASSRTLLIDFRGDNYVADNSWRMISDIEIPPGDETVYIAFRYVTVVNWLDVRFDNLRISSNTIDNTTEQIKDQSVIIYPNPTSDQLMLSGADNFDSEVRIYSTSGRLICIKTLSNGSLNISDLPSGNYSLEVEIEGNKLRKQFIKK